MDKKDIMLYASALAYCIGIFIIISGIPAIPENQYLFEIIYLAELIVIALFLVFLGLEDNRTLKVSWASTLAYLIFCAPAIGTAFIAGFALSQLPFLIAGIAFFIVSLVYSLISGRGGADRDIVLISTLCYPMVAVLALVPSLIISVVMTRKKQQKFPLLFPYSIMFGLLALAQIVILF